MESDLELKQLMLRLNDAQKWANLYRSLTGDLARRLFVAAPEAEVSFTSQTFNLNKLVRLHLGALCTPLSIVSLFINSKTRADNVNLNCILDLPSDQEIDGLSDTSVSVLGATNLCRLDHGKYLAWSTEHNVASEVFIVILDTSSGVVYLGATALKWPRSCYEIFDFTLRQFLPLNYFDAADREAFLGALPEANELAFVTKPFSQHFGHFILNDLGPLSHLDAIGYLDSFAHVYRPRDNNARIFSIEDERDCFSPNLNNKIAYVDNPLLEALRSGYGVVYYKDAIVSRRLGDAIRFNLPRNAHSHLTVCIGIRGGSREALNLEDAAVMLAEKLYLIYNRPIHFVLDGMSRTSINSSSSHALLSLEREFAVAEAIASRLNSYDWASTVVTVNLSLIDQLKHLKNCLFSFTHSGTSVFKYGYLVCLPTLIHSNYDPSLVAFPFNLDSEWDPMERYMHLENSQIVPRDYSEREGGMRNPKYDNYLIDLAACEKYFSGNDFFEFLAFCDDRLANGAPLLLDSN
jgi:hypothetical protein